MSKYRSVSTVCLATKSLIASETNSSSVGGATFWHLRVIVNQPTCLRGQLLLGQELSQQLGQEAVSKRHTTKLVHFTSINLAITHSIGDVCWSYWKHMGGLKNNSAKGEYERPPPSQRLERTAQVGSQAL